MIDEAGGTRWRRINGEPANGAGLAYTGRKGLALDSYARQQMHIRCMPIVTCSTAHDNHPQNEETARSGELDFTPLGV